MMKTTLDSSDPAGWYECDSACGLRTGLVYYWTGNELTVCRDAKKCVGSYTSFRRLFTEADVAALNDELQTLRAENDKLKENVRTINRDYNLRISERNDLQGKLEVCEKYAAAFQQSSTDYLNELRKAREENATLEATTKALLEQSERFEAELEALNEELKTLRDQVASLQEQLKNSTKYADMFQKADGEKLDELRKVRAEYDELFAANQVLQFQVSTLTSDLEKAKSQPYAMRKAERPDCVGLWRNEHGDICKVKSDKDINSFGEAPPYYYLGPLPIIPKEQQPPQVVTIRHEGKTYRAIPSDNPEYWTLLGDDGVTCGVAIGKVEVVK